MSSPGEQEQREDGPPGPQKGSWRCLHVGGGQGVGARKGNKTHVNKKRARKAERAAKQKPIRSAIRSAGLSTVKPSRKTQS